jgi:hypothetical protein
MSSYEGLHSISLVSSLLSSECCGLFPQGIKQSGREADHLASSRAKLVDVLSYSLLSTHQKFPHHSSYLNTDLPSGIWKFEEI